MTEIKDIFRNSVLSSLLIVFAAVGLAILARPDARLHLYFCDVGQGDAILIKTPQNKKILVDGGPDDRVLDCLSRALPFYDRTLDLMILTHPHADHVNGLISVLRRYQVKKAIFYQLDYQSADYQEFIGLVSQKRIENLAVVGGDDLALDQQVSAHVWYPLSKAELKVLGAKGASGASSDPYDGEDVNDSSLVLQFVCGNFEALLTGDAPDTVQKLLLSRGVVESADILKVAHQGAKDGLDQDFLEKVNPKLAVIFVGQNNRYGHPHAETLEELKGAGVEVRRTDLNGTIEVVSDCKSWWVQ